MSSSPISHRSSTSRRCARAVGGDVTGPGDEGYDGARQAWNLVADQRPAAVVHAGGERRRRRGGPLRGGARPQGRAAGHGPRRGRAPAARRRHPPAHGAARRPERRSRRPAPRASSPAPCGARSPTRPASTGSSASAAPPRRSASRATRSAAASAGWRASTGWPRDHVIAAELVTGTGEHVRVDAESDPELFWSLRGGGGPGVVTALEFSLLPLATSYAGSIAFDAEHAGGLRRLHGVGGRPRRAR